MREADLPPFTAIILAAQRTGVVNPLARRAGVSHKCLVPILGRPLITYVLDTLATIGGLRAVHISLEADAHAELEPLLARYRAAGMTISLIASRPGIADSVTAAAEGAEPPFIVTTADNVLMTAASVNGMRAALRDADVAAALASEAAIKAAHPEGQRNFYQFGDGGYANCNLYGIAGPHAFDAAEIFREGGQFMNNPKRLVTAFGLLNIVLMRWKLLSLHGAMKRLSKRFGLRFRAVVLADGSQAIDVDNERTYDAARELLERRAALGH